MGDPVPLGIPSRKRVIALTDAALEKLSNLLAEEAAGTFLRIGVRSGGCSGFIYEMYFDTDTQEGDAIERFGAQTQVNVDPESTPLLRGSTLDYRDGLDGTGFKIENPNVTRACGCGKSFS